MRLVANRGEFSIDALKQAAGSQSSRVKQFVMQQSGTPDLDDVTVVFVRLPQEVVDDIAKKLRGLSGVVSVETADPA